MSHTVLVSRQWGPHPITVTVTDEAIGIAMPLDEYVAALLEQVGSPVGIFTKAQLGDRVRSASETIVGAMKHTSTGVV